MAYKLPNEALEDNTIKVGKLDTAVTNAFVPVGGIIMWNGSIASNTTGITAQVQGSGANIDNRSSYFALCYIMRVS